MDPRKQECFGHYLYGAGYFARDENTLTIVSGGYAEHFCLSCPRKVRCEAEQRTRVSAQRPEASERYERAMLAAMRRGFSELLASVALAERDLNPYYTDAMESFKRGHADRGSKAGPLVAPKGEVDAR